MEVFASTHASIEGDQGQILKAEVALDQARRQVDNALEVVSGLESDSIPSSCTGYATAVATRNTSPDRLPLMHLESVHDAAD
jgi:hypothetical protein